MSGLLGMLTQTLGGNEISQLSKAIGADESQTSGAIAAALPMLMSALAKNSASPEGASALANALDKDHDGGILENLGGFLSSGDQGPGSAILKHVLGGKQNVAQNGLSQMSGMSTDSAGKLMAMLAPMVLGQLGKAKKEQGLDVSGLAGMLAGERDAAASQMPDQMGMIGKMLDMDGDGSIMDDVANIGMKFLGGMFGKK